MTSTPPNGTQDAPPDTVQDTQRLDRWLWYARFTKTRTLAAKLCEKGSIRLNGDRITKPSRLVRFGDILTFSLGAHIRVIRIKAPGLRRGPAVEARLLYEDLDPPAARKARTIAAGPVRPPGTGRPTKKQRRRLDALHDKS